MGAYPGHYGKHMRLIAEKYGMHNTKSSHADKGQCKHMKLHTTFIQMLDKRTMYIHSYTYQIDRLCPLD